MTYDILATGSSGNAVVINGEILIDCGVPYKTLEESGYIKDLKLVLLTHGHGDHFKSATVRRLHQERPILRFGCCEWMVCPLLEAGVSKWVIDLYKSDGQAGFRYSTMALSIMAETLFHDVPSCGYHIYQKGESLFYATDTGTLDGIEAKSYDLYLIEANYTEAELEQRAAEKLERGEFAYEVRAARNHLSREQAKEWLARNAGPDSEVRYLHQHKEV